MKTIQKGDKYYNLILILWFVSGFPLAITSAILATQISAWFFLLEIPAIISASSLFIASR
jgi:hypothetical protein